MKRYLGIVDDERTHVLFDDNLVLQTWKFIF